MSNCLNEARIRAAADDELPASERQHLEECGECRARVEAARRAAAELTSAAASLAVPASLSDRVGRALATGPARGGATTLRDRPAFRVRSNVWLTTGAVAAALLVMIFALPPLDAPRTMSAAEILDRSLQTLAPASGTELLEFDLELQLPRMASRQNGAYRVEQLVDYEMPGRYRIVRYAPNGELLDAISDEPTTAWRTVVTRVDGQPVVFRLTIPTGMTGGLRDLERQNAEAMIRVLQAAAGQTVREEDAGSGKRYIVELPQVADTGAAGLWELARARVVVDAADFQILELAAAGSYMNEPVSVSFRLRRRQMRPSAQVPPSAFAVPTPAEAITIDGTATDDVAHDLLVSTLRELVRSRR